MRQSGRPLTIDKRIILVGAGNAHLLFVRRWGMQSLPGAAVTLVNDGLTIPYSAMVPGRIAGRYDRDRATIDLVRLCPSNGVRLIREPVVRIDPVARQLHFAARPPLGYDVLSLGLGSVPMPPPGAERLEWSFALRPLRLLIEQLERLETHLRESPRQFRLAVVGGGASGCELTLAIKKRLAGALRGSLLPREGGLCITLIHAGERLLPNFPARASRLMEQSLRASEIEVRLSTRVACADANGLLLEDGSRIACEGALWAIDPAPPAVLKDAGLPLDGQGYLQLNPTLQSLADPVVYGTGDCVAFPSYPDLPRNGVMAVRQGRVLFHNIIAAITGGRAREFRPQRAWLSILNTADGQAIASYGPAVCKNQWARRWKDRIDSRWMRMFEPPPPSPRDRPMPCGGCGSKVPGDVLASTLKRLDVIEHPRVLAGLRAAEDAAVFRTESEDEVEVQTVDYFNSFIDDPYLFGRIAALHAVSDLDAMNSRPFAALAIATVPYARGAIQSEMLGEMLAGAGRELATLGVALAGGHTTEGPEFALGFSITGRADPRRLFRKGGLKPGDRLILTKALGTGALLAAWMQGHCRAEWFEAAVKSMLIPNRGAAELLAAAGVRACTDVTGFGLAGHLLEMLDASGVSAILDPAAVTVLPGFTEVFRQGIFSGLHEGNARASCRFEGSPPPCLFDPQTSGGLLAGVEASRASEVIQRMHAAGFSEAREIGRVIDADLQGPVVRLSEHGRAPLSNA